MKTVVIFTDCHLRDRKVISNCTQFEADQFKRMAKHNGWPFTIRKGSGK